MHLLYSHQFSFSIWNFQSLYFCCSIFATKMVQLNFSCKNCIAQLSFTFWTLVPCLDLDQACFHNLALSTDLILFKGALIQGHWYVWYVQANLASISWMCIHILHSASAGRYTISTYKVCACTRTHKFDKFMWTSQSIF